MSDRYRRFILVAMFLLSASCGGNSSPTAPSDPASATVTSLTVILLAVGNDYQALATARLSDGTPVDVTETATWSTSDSAVATVDATGYVTSVADGTVNVIATYQGVTEQAALTVQLALISTVTDLTITDLTVGTGAEATVGSSVTVIYEGWLYDAGQPDNKGYLFDTSPVQGFTFVLGLGQVISGWDQGVSGMRVGGERRLIIPPDMAYGSTGAGRLIPPNATLVFDIILVSVY